MATAVHDASRNGVEAFEPVNIWTVCSGRQSETRERLPLGSYVMQISATTSDPKRQGRSRIAAQWIGFDVR